MVGVFRRSLSFPNKNPNRPSQKPHISHHIRSISLPCRSHPLFSQIKDEINGLKAWASTSKSSNPQTSTSTNLSKGLSLLKETHETLGDILQLPQTRESLRCQPLWVEKLLEDFLRFVDIYGMFQTSILALKEEHSAAQMAIRKRDHSKIALYAKAKKKMVKEMDKLVSGIKCVTQLHVSATLATVADAELAGVMADVVGLTVSVSVGLFSGIAMSFEPRKMTWTQMVKLSRRGRRVSNKEHHHEGIQELQDQVESLVGNLKKGQEDVRSVLNRMRESEGCISGIETVTDKVFRALINSRVALLNALTLTH